MSKKKYKVGLVLSGGGTRGFAHLGVIQALHENNIYPEIISGVSAGAIVGALYADGKQPEEILKLLAGKKLHYYLKLFVPRQGLVKMSGFVKTLRKTLSVKTFEELKKPLLVYAVNINKGKYVCFDKGDIVDAVTASSSIPVVFPPVKINNEYYLDGGIINNFPVMPLIGICEKIIGVNLNPIGETDEIKNIRQIAERAFHISLKSHTIGLKEKCDLYIEPSNLEKFSLLNLNKANKAFDVGYEETIKSLEKKNFKL